MPVDLLANKQETPSKGVDLFEDQASKDRIIKNTIQQYNKAQDPDGMKAKALSELRVPILDQDGELYFNKNLPPDQRIEHLKKIDNPSMSDSEVAKIIERGGSVLSAGPVSDEPPPEEGAMIIDVQAAKDRNIFQKLYDLYQYGKWDDKEIAFRKAMEEGFYPTIGKEIRNAQKRDELKRREFIMSESSPATRATMRGFQNVKKIPLGFANVAEEYNPYSLFSGQRLDLVPDDIKDRLETDIQSWMIAADVPEPLKKEWQKNQGNLWYRPDFVSNFLLESGPTMALSIASGGGTVSAFGSSSKFLQMLQYGAGSAFSEALSNAGQAVLDADAQGATEDEKAQVAGDVFKKDFTMSMILNSLQYGTGSATRLVKNKALKVTLGGLALGAEAEQELRQDEYMQDAINQIVLKNAEKLDPWYYGRVGKGLLDPAKRDVTMLSFMMGVADPAMGYISDLKQTVAKTGRNKGKFDLENNYTAKYLREQIQQYEAKETLDPAEQQRYNVLKENEGDILQAVPDLIEIDAKEKMDKYNRDTLQGIMEDATIGEDAKQRIQDMPDPHEQASAEQVNEVAANMRESFGLTNQDTEQIANVYDLKQLSKAEAVSLNDTVQNAKAQGLHLEAQNTAKKIMNTPTERAILTGTEFASLVHAEGIAQSKYDVLIQEAQEAESAGNEGDAIDKRAKAEGYLQEMELYAQAAERAGTGAAKSLSFRRIRLNRDTFSLAAMVKRAKEMKKGDLTPKQQKEFENLSSQIKEANTRIAKLELELEAALNGDLTAEGQEFVDEVVQVVKREKKKQSKEQLASREEAIKAKLRALGMRVNDITGVSAEVALQIGLLAELKVEQGINKLPDLLAAMKQDLPDMSEQSILDAFSRRRRNVIAETQKQTKLVLKELKKQATIQSKIKDAYDGIFEPTRKKAVTSAEILNLQNLLQDLKNSHALTEVDPQKMEHIRRRLEEAQEMLEQQAREIKAKRPVDNEKIIFQAKRLQETRALMNTLDRITELELAMTDVNKLKQLLTPKKRQEVINQQLEKERDKLFALKRHASVKIQEASPIYKDLGRMYDAAAGGLMSATLSMDLGAVLRQGKIATTRAVLSPLEGKKGMDRFNAFVGALRDATAIQAKKVFTPEASQAIFDNIMRRMYEHPHYSEWVKNKLALTDPIEGMTRREEGFTSSDMVEKIPFWGSRLIKGSEQAHVTFLNLMRIGLYEDFKAKNPDASNELLQDWAKYVNSATGRGQLPAGFEQNAKALTRFFLAPRWAWSNVQMSMLTPQNWMLAWKNPEIRKEMVKDYAGFISTRLTFLALGVAGGGEVEWGDPTSPDWGKLRFGNTRIDPWGGAQQPVRLMFQVMMDRKNAKRHITKYIQYKFSPSVQFASTMWTGKDPVGREVIRFWDPKKGVWENIDKNALIDAITPLIIQTSKEVADDQGVGSLLWAIPAEFYGVNVSSYEKTKKKGKSRPSAL